jgi:hypothetical protein
MTILSAHQSQFLPWPPYFRKIALSDVFVWMDDVQFQRRGVQHRNSIWTPQGDRLLTLALKKNDYHAHISDMQMADAQVLPKIWVIIESNYKKAPYWSMHAPALASMFLEPSLSHLDKINWVFVQYVLRVCGIETRIVRGSALGCETAKSARILEYCLKLNAQVYLSGEGAQAYLQADAFACEGIEIRYLPSVTPVYTQFKAPALSDLSMLDMLMNQSIASIRDYLLEPMT